MKLRNITLSIICLLMTNLNAISLRDYIATNGMPKIENRVGLDLYLDLSNKELTDLDGLLEIPGIKKITNLHLQNNKIRELPEGLFDNLAKLDCLNLSGNQIIELSASIFNALVNLRRLNLSYNQIIELPKDIFNTLVDLTELNLSNNQISELHDGIFNALVKLIMLDLSDNQIKELPKDIFNTLVALGYLDISNNKIQLAKEAFATKYYLTRNNNLTFLFKTPTQERIEDLQVTLIENIKERNIPGINDALARLKAINQENPKLRAVIQTDAHNDTALHIVLRLGYSLNLAKTIFDIMPECMHERNKLDQTPMHLLLLFRHVPDRYDSIAISDEAERSSKNEEYNMISIICFLKYIFAQDPRDPNLEQVLYQPDNTGMNPVESLIPAGRRELIKALVKLTTFVSVFIAPFEDLTNEELNEELIAL